MNILDSQDIDGVFLKFNGQFWTLGLLNGVLDNHPRPWLSVQGWSLDISETAHSFFLKFCMKLCFNKVTKSNKAGILKKINLGIMED